MRFQDAARDARAVVYAGIQADPLVARAADLLADATQPQRVLARAVMNGETTDPDGWRATFPAVFASGAAATAAERERSDASSTYRWPSPTGASRSAARSAGRWWRR